MTRFTLYSPAAMFSMLIAVFCSFNVAQAQVGALTYSMRPFSHVGVDAHVGINGVGFDLATPVAQHFNVRVGGISSGTARSLRKRERMWTRRCSSSLHM